jgi:adenine-specific DNA-methyltransferase
MKTGGTMKKLDGKTKDLTAENISEIRRIFPSCIREGKVDFDALRALLDKEGSLTDDKEKYSFTWTGKQQSKRIALQQNSGTLRPVRAESVDFDSTKNMIIEGDNLEALRLLLKPYSGKIKIIYIDPPYNTGNDFVYKDDFSDNLKNYVEKSGQALESNPETKGRFHSDWLSMMYPRLTLARNLLSEDGVIFVSIDDNEDHDLRMIANEVFGEENFIVQITREAIKGGSVSKFLRVTHDYVLVYAKNIDSVEFGGLESDGITLNLSDKKGPYAKGRELNKWGAGSRKEDALGMWFPIPGPNGEEVYPIRNDGSQGRWRLGKKKMLDLVKEGNAIFEKRENGSFIVYEKLRDASPRTKQFISIFKDNYINAKGTESIKSLFSTERSYFDYSKPVELVKDLILMSDTCETDIILDFFAGSGTTAHAVLEQNREDGGNRRFILIQLPEQTAEDSEAFKAGYKTIADICKERVRRVIKKIEKETKQNKLGEQKRMDLGFKVFKLDTTNIRAWDPDPKNLQASLEGAVSNMKDGRSDEDILYEILLKYGVDLTASIKAEKVDGKIIYNVGDGYLYVCLDKNLTKSVIEHIVKGVKAAQTQDKARVVFADACFKDDQDAVNAELALKKAGVEDICRI